MWGRQEADRINGIVSIEKYKLKNKLSNKAIAVDPRQQWLMDGGGRVVIGRVLIEIGRCYCVGAARSRSYHLNR